MCSHSNVCNNTLLDNITLSLVVGSPSEHLKDIATGLSRIEWPVSGRRRRRQAPLHRRRQEGRRTVSSRGVVEKGVVNRYWDYDEVQNNNNNNNTFLERIENLFMCARPTPQI